MLVPLSCDSCLRHLRQQNAGLEAFCRLALICDHLINVVKNGRVELEDPSDTPKLVFRQATMPSRRGGRTAFGVAGKPSHRQKCFFFLWVVEDADEVCYVKFVAVGRHCNTQVGHRMR